MNRLRLRSVVDAMDTSIFGVAVKSFRTFYWFGDAWSDAKTNEQEVKLDSTLSGFRDSDKSFSRLGSTVIFRVSEFDAVVFVSYVRRPSDRRVLESLNSIRQLIQRRDDAFHARHDALTGCVNKREFEIALKSRLQSGGAKGAENKALSSTNVFLVSLDLDHFKQINDSHGHQYGDVVLRSFAWRVDDVCKKFESESDGRFNITFARPGGEEFQIIVSGICSEQEVVAMAEAIRTAVNGGPLPSDVEFSTIERDGHAGGLALPHASARRVTVSIGVAGCPCVNPSAVDEAAALITRQADLAVYSSKLAGRDQVRSFPQILQAFGRVIEMHADAGVVAIDIGREVGVRVGQEFFVIPKDFTGNVDFHAGEGRSRRRAGTYPRYKVGRIAIFDVQSEVSFARVEHLERGVRKIVGGSYLEAIPLGSITHLIEGKGGAGSFVPYEQVRAAIVKRGLEKHVAVFAIGLKEAGKVVTELGTGVVNLQLARVHKCIKSVLGRGYSISHVEPAALIVDASDMSDLDVLENFVHEILSRLAAESMDSLSFASGVFRSDFFDVGDRGYAIECAIAALRAAELKNEALVSFDDEAALSVLVHSRGQDAVRGLADYKKFTEMGVVSSSMENLAGLLELERSGGDKLVAESHFKAAMRMDPSDGIYPSNIAIVCFLTRRLALAFEYFAKVETDHGLSDIPPQYLGAYAISAYRTLSLDSAETVANVVRLVDAAFEVENLVAADVAELQRIREKLGVGS